MRNIIHDCTRRIHQTYERNHNELLYSPHKVIASSYPDSFPRNKITWIYIKGTNISKNQTLSLFGLFFFFDGFALIMTVFMAMIFLETKKWVKLGSHINSGQKLFLMLTQWPIMIEKSLLKVEQMFPSTMHMDGKTKLDYRIT